jgi:cell wall-associated NlpC family hydrolase
MNKFNRAVACFSLIATLGHTASLGVSAQHGQSVTHRGAKHTDTAIVFTESSSDATVAGILRKSEYHSIDTCGERFLSHHYIPVDSYMHRTYLSAATAKNPEINYGTVRTDGAILYSGPGMAYKVLGQASQGESVYIINLHNQWFEVLHMDQICYIHINDLQLKVFPYEIRISPNTENTPVEQRKSVASQEKESGSKKESSKSKSKKKTSAKKDILPEANKTPSKTPDVVTENKETAQDVKNPASKKEEITTENTGSNTAPNIISDARKYIGTPYEWGGTSPGGFDCSGFIQYVYSKNGINLPRSTTDQYQRGEAVKKSNLQPGDLVFLANTYRKGVSHVGIYIGEGNVIHASSSKGVTISSLSGSYFSEHYLGSRRIIN